LCKFFNISENENRKKADIIKKQNRKKKNQIIRGRRKGNKYGRDESDRK
jgi:hypothetical protein